MEFCNCDCPVHLVCLRTQNHALFARFASDFEAFIIFGLCSDSRSIFSMKFISHHQSKRYLQTFEERTNINSYCLIEQAVVMIHQGWIIAIWRGELMIGLSPNTKLFKIHNWIIRIQTYSNKATLCHPHSVSSWGYQRWYHPSHRNHSSYFLVLIFKFCAIIWHDIIF